MAENDDAAGDASKEVDIFRDAARARIATKLLAGALANSSTTFPSIFMIDCDGPDYGASYKSQAERMVKNSVTLADMLLAELDKREAHCQTCGGAGQVPRAGQSGVEWLTPCPACKR